MRRYRIQKPGREYMPLKPREWNESAEDKAEVLSILKKYAPEVLVEDLRLPEPQVVSHCNPAE